MTVVGYGSVVPAKPIVRNASTIVGVGMLGVQADGLVVVLDGPLVIAQVTVGVASVVEGVGKVGASVVEGWGSRRMA